VTVLDRLAAARGLVVLVDPARTSPDDAGALGERAAGEGVPVLLVGNSFGRAAHASAVARALRAAAPDVLLLLFPSSAADLVPEVDGVLFLSLISGRNAQYLIEEHVRAVPFFERHPGVDAVSTAYCLVDGGCVTAVESASQTRPLPADKPEFVHAHVSAAMRLGMQATYLDAGSGALRPVAPSLVSAGRAAARGPLFVGGGVRDADQVRRARDAGADYVVVGSLFEQMGWRTVGDLVHAAGS
jgi:putative glycerol-1-phosphate prenyltransferase